MALSVQQPTDGKLPINVRIGPYEGGALVAVNTPSGVTVQQPTDGKLQIIGAVVMGVLDGSGNFIQQLPS